MSYAMPPPKNAPNQRVVYPNPQATLVQQEQTRQIAAALQQQLQQQQQQQQQEQQQQQQPPPSHPQQQAPGHNPYMNPAFLSANGPQHTRAAVVSILAQTTNQVLTDLGQAAGNVALESRIQALERDKTALFEDNRTLHASFNQANKERAEAIQLLEQERAKNKLAGVPHENLIQAYQRLRTEYGKLKQERDNLLKDNYYAKYQEMVTAYREVVATHGAFKVHCQTCPEYARQIQLFKARNGIPPGQVLPGYSPVATVSPPNPQASGSQQPQQPNSHPGTPQVPNSQVVQGPRQGAPQQRRATMPANLTNQTTNGRQIPTPAMLLQSQHNQMLPPTFGQQGISWPMSGPNAPSPIPANHNRSPSVGQGVNQPQQVQSQSRPPSTPAGLQQPTPMHIDLALQDLPQQIFSNVFMDPNNLSGSLSRPRSVISVTSSSSRPNSAAPNIQQQQQQQQQNQQQAASIQRLEETRRQQQQQQQGPVRAGGLLSQQQHSQSLPATPIVPAQGWGNAAPQPSTSAAEAGPSGAAHGQSHSEPLTFSPSSTTFHGATTPAPGGGSTPGSSEAVATPPPPSASTDGGGLSSFVAQQGITAGSTSPFSMNMDVIPSSTTPTASKRNSSVFHEGFDSFASQGGPDDARKKMRMSVDAGQPEGSIGSSVPATNGEAGETASSLQQQQPVALAMGHAAPAAVEFSTSTDSAMSISTDGTGTANQAGVGSATTSLPPPPPVPAPEAPPQAALNAPPADEGDEDDDDDDELEEVTVGDDGLRIVSECLLRLFEVQGNARVCRLCKTRHMRGLVEAPVPYVDAPDELLVQHCTAEHEQAWSELRHDV